MKCTFRTCKRICYVDVLATQTYSSISIRITRFSLATLPLSCDLSSWKLNDHNPQWSRKITLFSCNFVTSYHRQKSNNRHNSNNAFLTIISWIFLTFYNFYYILLLLIIVYFICLYPIYLHITYTELPVIFYIEFIFI